ncbi:MAG: metal-dependent hydrolase [Candidatus Anstonellales archaeon]
MRGKTHFITGSLVTATVANMVYKDSSIVPYLIGGLSALVPDLDVEKSMLSNMMYNIVCNKVKSLRKFRNSDIFRKVFITIMMGILGLMVLSEGNLYLALMFGYIAIFPYTEHRTLSHSLLSALVVSYLVMMGLNSFEGYGFIVSIYVFIGYITHLIADTLTVTGVPYLYPIITKKQRVPLMKTGSWKEFIFIGICLVIWLVAVSI